MKIVNEKGKLFGLINIIDLSIIILILLIGAVFLFKPSGTSVTSSETMQDITVTFRGTVRVGEQIKALKEGDQLISILNPEDARIKSITFSDLQVPISTADGKQVYSPDPLRKELVVKFSMKTAGGNGIIRLGTQEVAVGKNFTLKTRTFESLGTVEAIELN